MQWVCRAACEFVYRDKTVLVDSVCHTVLQDEFVKQDDYSTQHIPAVIEEFASMQCQENGTTMPCQENGTTMPLS